MLNSETFLSEASKKDVLSCIFLDESEDNLQEILLRVFVNNHQDIGATIGYLDVKKSADIAQMFGISMEQPTLLIMREQVVLFCESVPSLDKFDIFSILEQIKKLDMKKIKNQIQTEKRSASHLFGRNVCPTEKNAWK